MALLYKYLIDETLLKYRIDNDMIDLSFVQEQIKARQTKKDNQTYV